MTETCMSRRSFVKSTSALAALAAAGGSVLANQNPFGVTEARAAENDQDTVCWSACSTNCEGRCALRLHVKDNEVYWVETDNTGNDEFGNHQIRACQRGRSIRRWLNSPDRLQYPMKRVGERGSGQFERISWDEAIDTIASEYKRILSEYGPESIFIPYGTGVQACNIADFIPRLCVLNGGYLNRYGTYSSAQIAKALPYLYGKRAANSNSDIVNAELVVLFGENAAENRMSGGGAGYHLMEALERGHAKVIVIDPRYSDSAATRADEWIPIRPGTDAALVDALAYVLITEDLVDEEFLATYCIGYDESTMPESAKGKNASYKDYILGNGADKTAKTPAWASEITRIPQETIERLAREIGTAKPCAIYQGKGPQRRSNGEQTARAICMLPILTGNVGINGGNTGSDHDGYYLAWASVPMEDNPVETSISTFNWLNAIDHPTELTALADGVKGKDRLEVPIKFMWNYAGNCLTNQHGEIDRAHEILKDDTKCEFIVVWETFMTDSAKYADILLPDAMPQEQPTYNSNDYAGNMGYVILGEAATEPKFERRTLYSVLTDIAEKMGCKEAFTEGHDEMEWLEIIYNSMIEDGSPLPPFAEAWKSHIVKKADPDGHSVAFKDFREDPIANPLKTPSGKIEIYSEELAEIAGTWELDEADIIDPLPVYAPENGGYLNASEATPLQMTGYHFKGRTHSCYAPIDVLQQANRQQVWINPADAESRGIQTGDRVKITNAQGTTHMEARVTPRVMPGVVAAGQGAWYKGGADGTDEGGCINTLVSGHPSPLAKANPSHTILVEIAKA